MVARPGSHSPRQRRGPDIPKIEASGAIVFVSASGKATSPSGNACRSSRLGGAHLARQEQRFSSLALIACDTLACQDCFP